MSRLIFFSVIVILALFLLEIVSALEIGISPSEVSLSMNKGEEKCVNFTLFSDRDVSFDLNSFWSESKSRGVEDYKTYPFEENISFSYNIINRTNYDGNYQMCLSAGKSGRYYGVLIAKILDRNAAVGMWINLDVVGENNVFNYLGLTLSSNKNNNSDNKEILNPIFLLFSSTFLLLFFLLLILVFYLRKNRRRLEE